MSEAISITRIHASAERIGDGLLGAALGLGFTFLLFFAIARFEDTSLVSRSAEIEDLRAMSIPLDAPPARPVEHQPASAPPMPLSGIEIAAADSPVKITVMEPDLMALMPDVQIAPSATIQQEHLYSSLKPQIDSGLGDFDRVFQQHEVDEKPSVLARPNPRVPKFVRGKAKMLRISMLVVVDAKGGVDSVRVLDSSGNPEFDAILIKDVSELWVFKPASKKGRRVKCLLQQTVRVTWEAGSPFGN